jgi:N-hydroxyarylamine O-acetyltransferase
VINVPDYPRLPPDLLEQVLEKLGLTEPIPVDLDGLGRVLRAFVFRVPLDNIRKRIWFAGDRTTPLPGGEPVDFFEHWLKYGTAGTCWPLHGGFTALLLSLGFPARRIAGALLMGVSGMTDEFDFDTNHASVIVRLDGTDYLTDCNIGCVEPLPLLAGEVSRAGRGIHELESRPFEDWVEVRFFPQIQREKKMVFRPGPIYDPVDHGFCLAEYERSKEVSPFNEALFVCSRHPDRFVSLGRNNQIVIDADGVVTKTPVTEAERKRSLVEDHGFSPEIVERIPPDVEGSLTVV